MSVNRLVETDVFPQSYADARQRFRHATTDLRWTLESHSIGGRGPDGEELTLDIAWSPGEKDAGTLVISSGIHGVEGFFGSAVQCAQLRAWARQEPPPPRVVFLHALNPYGFAWLRRVDENNIDLNRNFLLPGEPYSRAPAGYAELDPLLNPPRPPSRLEPFLLKALVAIARQGMPALRQAIAGGQYEYPRGLFYGGAQPATVQQILVEHLPRWLGGSRRVMHLDFHTGLGKSGTHKLLLDYRPSEKQLARLRSWFGPRSVEACAARNISYETRGGFGAWCVARDSQVDYLFACAEFGTYGPLRVLSGLRAENQAHHWLGPADPATRRAKLRLKELFCPASPHWRRTVLKQSMELITRAAAGLRPPG